jgi:hypothetical protein
MLPEAYIHHQTINRIRIRVPSRKGDMAYFAALRDRVSRVPGVDRIEVNPVTGSLLLVHQLEMEQIAEFGATNRLFALKQSRPVPKTIVNKVADTFNDLNVLIKAFTENQVDIPSIAFATFMTFGLFQIGSGNFMVPVWYTAFWYSMNIVLKAGTGEENGETDVLDIDMDE